MSKQGFPNPTRRDLLMLLPALAASRSVATESPSLRSKFYRVEDLPVRRQGENSFRPILDGKTHAGFPMELHQTELAPGQAPHPPHRHAHEEMFLIREGTLEITIADQSSRLGPGSVAYVASNDEHGVRNVGTTPSRYFVLALGREGP